MVRGMMGGALVAFVVAGASSAHAAMIYLDCRASIPERNAAPTTWAIDTTARTVEPITGHTAVLFRNAEIGATKIQGFDRTQSGNVISFDLDRVSGELAFTFHHNANSPPLDAPVTFKLQCVAMEKPRI